MKLVNLKNIVFENSFRFEAKDPQLDELNGTYRTLGELERALKDVKWEDKQGLQESNPNHEIDFTTFYVIGSRQFASLAFQVYPKMYSNPQAIIRPEY